MDDFVIHHYLEDKPNPIAVKLSPDLVYAEDIVIDLAKSFGINRIARHLFGLYHYNNKVWLASNQLLAEWTETKTLYFRVRFRPKHINALKVSLNPTIIALIAGYNNRIISIDSPFPIKHLITSSIKSEMTSFVVISSAKTRIKSMVWRSLIWPDKA